MADPRINKSIVHFLCDVLDCPAGAVGEFVARSSLSGIGGIGGPSSDGGGGSSSGSSSSSSSSVLLLGAIKSDALAANLAFGMAWSAAFGVRPTRVDFADFVRRLAGANESLPFLSAASRGAAWNDATSRALQSTLLESTPLRLSPQQVAQLGGHQPHDAAAAAHLDA
jgi:hypothetical protein